MESSIWWGLTFQDEEIKYPGYRRRKAYPTSLSLSEKEEVVTHVEAEFPKGSVKWGPITGFFFSNQEEGGTQLYKGELAYAISEVKRDQNFSLATTFTSPIPKGDTIVKSIQGRRF